MDITLAMFNLSGSLELVNERLMRRDIGPDIVSQHDFSNFGDMLSAPPDFFGV